MKASKKRIFTVLGLVVILLAAIIFAILQFSNQRPQLTLQPDFQGIVTEEQAQELYDYIESCRKEATAIADGKQNIFSETIQDTVPSFFTQLNNTPISQMSELELDAMIRFSYYQIAMCVSDKDGTPYKDCFGSQFLKKVSEEYGVTNINGVSLTNPKLYALDSEQIDIFEVYFFVKE